VAAWDASPLATDSADGSSATLLTREAAARIGSGRSSAVVFWSVVPIRECATARRYEPQLDDMEQQQDHQNDEDQTDSATDVHVGLPYDVALSKYDN